MAIPASSYVDILAKAHQGRIEGQTKSPPKYWITTTSGMSGYFAVMMWDGMGFEEPWDSGIGRYRKKEQAVIEAKQWAETEGLTYID